MFGVAVNSYLTSKGFGGEEEFNTFLFGLSCLILFIQGVETGPPPVGAFELLVPEGLREVRYSHLSCQCNCTVQLG